MSLVVSSGKKCHCTTVRGAEENECRVKKNPCLGGRGADGFECWSRVAIPGMLTLSHLDLATVGRIVDSQ